MTPVAVGPRRVGGAPGPPPVASSRALRRTSRRAARSDDVTLAGAPSSELLLRPHEVVRRPSAARRDDQGRPREEPSDGVMRASCEVTGSIARANSRGAESAGKAAPSRRCGLCRPMAALSWCMAVEAGYIRPKMLRKIGRSRILSSCPRRTRG